MNPTALHQAARNFVGQVPPPSNWSTRIAQSNAPVTTEDLLCGCCCIPCSSAMAKSTVDKTHPLFNFLCFGPCGTYSWIRNQYNIQGVCGDDLGYSIFCPLCTNRRAVTEARLRGTAPNAMNYGANSAEWARSLFDCDPCEFLRICFCLPCMVHEVREKLQPTADSCCFDAMCIAPTSMYGQVRHSYGIVTDFPIAEDVCLPIICFLCAFNRAHKQAMTVPLYGMNMGMPPMPMMMPMGGGYLPSPGYRPV